MYKILLTTVFSALVLASAHAVEINMPLSDDEQRALREILDLATKAGGLAVASTTVHFAQKLETLRRQSIPPNEK